MLPSPPSHSEADVGDGDARHALEPRVCVFVPDGGQLHGLYAGADVTGAVGAVVLEVAIPGGPLEHEVGE
eukprot:scaffold60521_cov16-Tisochrysis_lutea.AAC.1